MMMMMRNRPGPGVREKRPHQRELAREAPAVGDRVQRPKPHARRLEVGRVPDEVGRVGHGLRRRAQAFKMARTNVYIRIEIYMNICIDIQVFVPKMASSSFQVFLEGS